MYRHLQLQQQCVVLTKPVHMLHGCGTDVLARWCPASACSLILHSAGVLTAFPPKGFCLYCSILAMVRNATKASRPLLWHGTSYHMSTPNRSKNALHSLLQKRTIRMRQLSAPQCHKKCFHSWLAIAGMSLLQM